MNFSLYVLTWLILFSLNVVLAALPCWWVWNGVLAAKFALPTFSLFEAMAVVVMIMALRGKLASIKYDLSVPNKF